MTTNLQKVQPDYSQWPNKQQAADALEVSTKTVEKFAEEGKLQMVRWRRPSGGPKISVYHPADVERLRRERFPDQASSFVMPAPASQNPVRDSETSPSAPAAPRTDLVAEALLQLFPQLFPAFLNSEHGSQNLLENSEKRKPEVALTSRVYLTIAESAAYSGLPEKQLRQLIADGTLPARRQGHTRVRRRDLDAL